MDDESHVRLVDTHSECDGGHDDVDLFGQKFVLVFGSDFSVHSRMVRDSFYSVDSQYLSEFFDLFAA